MRLRLELPADPLQGPPESLPPCSAICPDTPVQWEHPCTFRARWLRDGYPVCGVHVARRVLLVEVPDAAADVIRFRRHA